MHSLGGHLDPHLFIYTYLTCFSPRLIVSFCHTHLNFSICRFCFPAVILIYELFCYSSELRPIEYLILYFLTHMHSLFLVLTDRICHIFNQLHIFFHMLISHETIDELSAIKEIIEHMSQFQANFQNQVCSIILRP